jgi:hypothetical protein
MHRFHSLVLTPINGTFFSTPLRGISTFTKQFSATLFSTPLWGTLFSSLLRGKKAQKIISKVLIVPITLLSFSCPGFGESLPTGFIVDHSLFAELLARYVNEGKVDYSGFKREEKQIDAYLTVLEKTDTARLASSEQFAFYINAYNAWTIKLIIGAYPGISSIWDIGGRFFNKPFQKKIARLDGATVSLDHIENDILRPRFKDERVHFAINCAAKSCPPLRPDPYCGEIIDRQLDEVTRAFINNPDSNRLEGDRLYVSKIFKWFSSDFKDDVPGFFVKYATDTLKERLTTGKQRIRVTYLDYDWSLNGA